MIQPLASLTVNDTVHQVSAHGLNGKPEGCKNRLPMQSEALVQRHIGVTFSPG
jgi:hypothetical protein